MERKLKSNVYSASREISKQIADSDQLEFESNANDVIGELVWKKLIQYGGDLEAFMKHGRRSSVNADDVKLLARNNAALQKHLEDKHKEMKAGNNDNAAEAEQATSKRKRKTKS